MDLIEILSKVGFDWRMALSNLVSFLIVFFILKKYAFEPINKILKTRRSKIEEGLENAKIATENFLKSEENYNLKIEHAKKDSTLIIDKARKAGDEIIKNYTKQAEEKTVKIIEDARKEINKEKELAKKEIKEEIISLSLFITEKLLSENIDKEKNIKIINEFLNKKNEN
ncbi:ATP synthase F0 subunit B [bacterium]|nr:ATP synthase F0 subunit B [bacterium]